MYDAIRLERMESLRRGEGESARGYCHRVRGVLDQLALAGRIQWTGRRTWSTHTYPGGCWICDTFAVGYAFLEELVRYSELEEEDIASRQEVDEYVRSKEGEKVEEEGL